MVLFCRCFCWGLLGYLVLSSPSRAEESHSWANVYHPTTECELLYDVYLANTVAAPGTANIIDLGGLVFEYPQDCVAYWAPSGMGNCASTLGLASDPGANAVCLSNPASGEYAFGPTALPEIYQNMTFTNGRIIRSESASGPNANFRLMTILSDAVSLEVSLFKVALENGNAQPATNDNGNGGAIYVAAFSSNPPFSPLGCVTLTLNTVKLGHNFANDSGGGLYIGESAQADISTTIISNNAAAGNDPTAGNNGGGGIAISVDGSLSSMVNSSIMHNYSQGLGGGVNNQGIATDIANNTFAFNLNCVPVEGSGECEHGSDPSGVGGGWYNDSSAILLELTQNTFYGNIALSGGGLYNEAGPTSAVYLNNNTFTNNQASMGGGGIDNEGVIGQFVSNLIAGNLDLGISSQASPDLLNDGAIVMTGTPISGLIVEGYNLIGNCGACTPSPCTAPCTLVDDVNFDIVGSSMNPIAPKFDGALRRNGGPTQTVALAPDSPAVDNGLNNLGLSYDQRGPGHPRVVSGTCDIGSFELLYDFPDWPN